MWITPKRGVMFVVFISHKNIFFDFLILPSHLLCAVSSLLSVCCVMRFTRRESLILSEAWIYFDMQYPATALPSHLEPCFYQCSAICWWFVALQFKLHSVCVRILRVMFSVCACNMCQPLRGCFSAGFHLILVSRFKHILQSLSSYFKGTNWLFQTFHFFTFLAESQMRRSIPLSCPCVKAGRQLAQ